MNLDEFIAASPIRVGATFEPHLSKDVCVHCGSRGHEWGTWKRTHDRHVTCTCGKEVTVMGLGQHRGSMKRHGNPCPDFPPSGQIIRIAEYASP